MRLWLPHSTPSPSPLLCMCVTCAISASLHVISDRSMALKHSKTLLHYGKSGSHCSSVCIIVCLMQTMIEVQVCSFSAIVYWLATHRPLKLRLCRGAAFCSAHTNMDHYCSQVLRHIRFTFLQCQTSLCAFDTVLHQAATIADCDVLHLSHADI